MTEISRRSLLQLSAASATAGLASAAVRTQDPKPAPKASGDAERPKRIRQSGVAWCYGGPLKELATLCVELGITGIDVVHPNKWEVLKEHGLECSLTNAAGNGFGIVRGLNQPKNHEGYLAMIRQRIDESAAAGFKNVLVFSGNRAPGLSDADGLKHAAKALKQVVGYAAEKGQVLMMELLNSKRGHRGYMFDRTQWGVDLVQAVGSDSFKLVYDIYHAQIMEGDVISTIREHHENFGHYHTAGVPGRSNLDDTQELNYAAIMRAIAETGFTGYVGQEFRPRGDRIAAFRQAVEVCDV